MLNNKDSNVSKVKLKPEMKIHHWTCHFPFSQQLQQQSRPTRTIINGRVLQKPVSQAALNKIQMCQGTLYFRWLVLQYLRFVIRR